MVLGAVGTHCHSEVRLEQEFGRAAAWEATSGSDVSNAQLGVGEHTTGAFQSMVFDCGGNAATVEFGKAQFGETSRHAEVLHDICDGYRLRFVRDYVLKPLVDEMSSGDGWLRRISFGYRRGHFR